jgi:hypothetical protein
MKKTLLFIILGIFILQLSAQDTVTALPSCAVDDWPHELHFEADGITGFHSARSLLWGKKYVAKANVVGVAAFAVTRKEDYKTYFTTHPQTHDHFYSEVFDTTFDNCYEYFNLYLRRYAPDHNLPAPYITYCHDTLETIASAKMHVLDTNVIGYFDRAPYVHPSHPLKSERYVPIRAVYFDTPVSLDGEFWVGMTDHIHATVDSTGHRWDYSTWPISLAWLRNGRYYGEGVDSYQYRDTILCATWRDSTMLPYIPDTVEFTGMSVWDYVELVSYVPCFPLFCEMPMYPSPIVLDSAGGGTADVPPVLSASDFVTLSPNPAVTEVRILSSTGIRRIRVYDISGRKVYESKADGLQATIPVEGWPNGTYTVHVDTPLGLAVKKLEKLE